MQPHFRSTPLDLQLPSGVLLAYVHITSYYNNIIIYYIFVMFQETWLHFNPSLETVQSALLGLSSSGKSSSDGLVSSTSWDSSNTQQREPAKFCHKQPMIFQFTPLAISDLADSSKSIAKIWENLCFTMSSQPGSHTI